VLVEERSVTVGGGPVLSRTLSTYDTAGNLLSQTDAEGRTTTSTYDARGNRLTETLPGGAVRAWTYDASNRIASEVDPLGNRKTHTRDQRGRLLRIVETDAAGAILSQTEFSYDARGNLAAQSVHLDDATLATTRYEYNNFGNRTAVIDPLGHRVEHEYDAQGRRLADRTTRTLPDGQSETSITRFAYDAKGRLFEKTDALGGVTRFEYDANGKRTAQTDALGHTTRYEYDAAGNLVRTIHADGSETTTDYDAEARKTGETDPAGNTTRWRYDEIGRTIAVILPDATPGDLADNPARHTEYDLVGRVLAEIDELGNTTRYEHIDAAGGEPAKQRVTGALGQVTTHEFDALGNRLRTVDALLRSTRYEYDGAGRLVGTRYDDGSETSTEYDRGGRKLAEVDTTGARREFDYDVAGRLIAAREALGFGFEYSYDELGNRVAATDALGRTTRFEFDALRRRTARRVPLGGRETFEHDALGHVVRHTDFAGAVVTYEYDAMGRRVLETHPGGTTIATEWNPGGKRASVTDARGTTREEYDARDRLVRRIEPDGGAITYEYDAAGNRSALATVAGTTRSTYDAIGRLLTVTDPDAAITRYTYDTVGNRASVAYPNGTRARYTYDALNRLTRLVNENAAGGPSSSYDYTLAVGGKRTRVVEGGPAVPARAVDYEYDALGRLVRESIDAAVDDDDVEIDYRYDLAGNRVEREVTGGGSVTTTTYAYDDNDRLHETRETVTVAAGPRRGGGAFAACALAAAPDVWVWRTWHAAMALLATALLALFVLSARSAPRGSAPRRAWRRVAWRAKVGMRACVCGALVFVFALGPDKLHALGVGARVWLAVAPGAVGQEGGSTRTVYSYDANGNLVERAGPRGTDTYDYDARDRLVSVDRSAGESVSYAYDADDIRVAKTVDGATTTYLVDHERPYAQVVVETTGAARVSYVHGDDLISMARPAADGGKRFYHYDGKHSTRALSDGAAAITDTYVYEAFGTLLDSTGSTENDFLFSGEQYDPNAGFYYLRARYYDPVVGRFLTQDAFSGNSSDPRSLHRYLYADSDPVNKSDPSGHFSLVEVTVVVAIVAILTTIVAIKTGSALDTARFVIYTAASIAALLAAAAEGPILGLAIFVGILQGGLQVLLDGVNPDPNATKPYWLISFMKGFAAGAAGVVAASFGLNPGLIAGAIALFQEIVDAVTSGSIDVKAAVTNIIVAAIAGYAGSAIGGIESSEIVENIVAVIVGLNASLILNDLRGLGAALGS